MSKFDNLITLFALHTEEAVKAFHESIKIYQGILQHILDLDQKVYEEYQSTGNLPAINFDSIDMSNFIRSNGTEPAYNLTSSSNGNSTKENMSEMANIIEPGRRLTRQTSKLNGSSRLFVKLERISENHTQTNSSGTLSKEIKKEKMDMPPPSRPPIKRTRTKKSQMPSNIDMEGVVIKKEAIDKGRDSDVIVHPKNVLNITVIDSDDEQSIAKTKPKRTRTKKRPFPEANSSEESENDSKKHHLDVAVPIRSTRTRTKQRLKEQDAQPDQTVVIQKATILDVTTVISKGAKGNETFVVSKPMETEQDQLMTEDEEDVIQTSVKETNKQTSKKQIFSAYASSPVKKRVAAFEKLGIVNAQSSTHTTRSAAKKLLEIVPSVSEEDKSPIEKKKRTAIPKLRTTPVIENRILSNIPRSIERPTQNPVTKTRSELKASQSEFRERELRRKQKEAEAMQKKEALINAQMEEKRRRNEERQLKAQQQRDMLEREKQQMLEAAEAARQLKMKQLTDKEEAKKKQLALKKEATKKQQASKKVVEGLPLLPTPDCYDSDDESRANKREEKRAWQNKQDMHLNQKIFINLSHIKKKLFVCKPQSPDVCEIFPGCKPISRNSSVIWDMTMITSAIEEEND